MVFHPFEPPSLRMITLREAPQNVGGVLVLGGARGPIKWAQGRPGGLWPPPSTGR